MRIFELTESERSYLDNQYDTPKLVHRSTELSKDKSPLEFDYYEWGNMGTK